MRLGRGLELLALLVVGLPTSTSAQTRAPFVLVPRGVPLRLQADEAAPGVHDALADQWEFRLGRYWVYRLVAEQGAWVEIETPTPHFDLGAPP